MITWPKSSLLSKRKKSERGNVYPTPKLLFNHVQQASILTCAPKKSPDDNDPQNDIQQNKRIRSITSGLNVTKAPKASIGTSGSPQTGGKMWNDFPKKQSPNSGFLQRVLGMWEFDDDEKANLPPPTGTKTNKVLSFVSMNTISWGWAI